jgi:hypothetical protein
MGPETAAGSQGGTGRDSASAAVPGEDESQGVAAMKAGGAVGTDAGGD